MCTKTQKSAYSPHDYTSATSQRRTPHVCSHTSQTSAAGTGNWFGITSIAVTYWAEYMILYLTVLYYVLLKNRIYYACNPLKYKRVRYITVERRSELCSSNYCKFPSDSIIFDWLFVWEFTTRRDVEIGVGCFCKPLAGVLLGCSVTCAEGEWLGELIHRWTAQ